MQGAGFFGGSSGGGDGGGSWNSPSWGDNNSSHNHNHDSHRDSHRDWDSPNTQPSSPWWPSRDALLGAGAGAALGWGLGSRWSRGGYQPIVGPSDPQPRFVVAPQPVFLAPFPRPAPPMSPLRAFACCLSCWLAVVALITLIALAAITPHSYSTTLTVVAGDRVVVDPGRDAVWTLGYDFRADVGADVFVFQDALDPVDDMEKEKDNKIVSADTATLPALNLTVPMFRTVNVTLPPGGAYKFVRFDLYQGSTWRVEWDLKKWNIEPSFAAFPSDSAFSHFTSTGDASESLHRRQAAKGVWTGRASRRGEYYFAWYTTDSRAYALSGSAAVHVSSLTYDTAGAIGVCRVPSSPPTAASTSTAAAPSPTKTRPREVDCAPYVFADAGARTTFLVVAPVPGEQGHEADSYAVDVTKPRNTILLLDVYLPPAAVLFFSLLICCPLCCGCRLYSCCVPDSEDVTVEPSYAPVVESPGAVGQSPASSAPSPRSGDGSHANEPEQPPSYQEAVRGGWADYGAVGRA